MHPSVIDANPRFLNRSFAPFRLAKRTTEEASGKVVPIGLPVGWRRHA